MKPRSLLVALALAACAGPTDIDGGGDTLLSTSALVYSLANRGEIVEVDIPFTFENRTGADVYLSRCGRVLPPFLERKDANRWRRAWTAPTYSCGIGGPVRLPPGEARADTLHVFAHPFGGFEEPQFNDLNVAGTYRLNWDRALSSYDFTEAPPGEPIALGHRVSNEFQLEGEYRAFDPNQPRLTFLDVTVSRSPIAVGDSARVTATGRDQFNQPMTVTDSITWWETSPAAPFGVPQGRVEMLPWGTVIGVSPGSALVHGRAGVITGQVPVQVTP